MNKENEQKLFERFTFFNPQGDIRNTLMPFGFECGDGWFEIIWDLCIALEAKVKEPFEVLQVKEKYGTLRCYVNGATEEVYDLINDAEKKSSRTCELCGKAGKECGGGWIVTRCPNCYRADDGEKESEEKV